MKILYSIIVMSTMTMCIANPVRMLGSFGTREASLWIMGDKASVLNSAATTTKLTKDTKSDIYISTYLASPNESGVQFSIGNEDLKAYTKPDFVDRNPPPDFSFAVFGENYDNDKTYDPPYRTPGGDYEIYDTAAKLKPSFSIWAAGATTLRPADADSETGIALRYAHARQMPEIQNLLSAAPNYGVFSEVAAFANGSNPSASLLKDARNVFDKFWINPSYPLDGLRAYSFSYSDAEFFILDAVSEKTTLKYGRDIPEFLGARQIKWLIRGLDRSTAKFKFVVMCTPAINPAESKENLTSAETERKEILQFLLTDKIGGVVFISAGKGYGEMTKLVRAGGYPIMEITVPPFTARPKAESEEMNYFRIPNSSLFQRGFAKIKIEGAENARSIKVAFIGPKGEERFSIIIPESELYKFE